MPETERDMTHVMSVITNWQSKAQKLADENRHSPDGPLHTAVVLAYQKVLDLLAPADNADSVKLSPSTVSDDPDSDARSAAIALMHAAEANDCLLSDIWAGNGPPTLQAIFRGLSNTAAEFVAYLAYSDGTNDWRSKAGLPPATDDTPEPDPAPVNEHRTTLHHDGFKHYFTCSAGDVTHTDNAYDTPAEAEIAAEGHRTRFGRNGEPDLAAAIDRAKREILDEVQAGRFVGSQITCFADLHDHMDANTLGGLADNDFPLDGDEQIEFGNELQAALDEWIKNNGMTNGIDASNDKWLTVGELRRHLAGFPDDTPITATNAGEVDYLNVVGASNPYQTGEPSVVLETRDDFDTRQF